MMMPVRELAKVDQEDGHDSQVWRVRNGRPKTEPKSDFFPLPYIHPSMSRRTFLDPLGRFEDRVSTRSRRLDIKSIPPAIISFSFLLFAVLQTTRHNHHLESGSDHDGSGRFDQRCGNKERAKRAVWNSRGRS